jgi:hypothetical protein
MVTGPQGDLRTSHEMPGSGRWFDMRDLGEVAEHIHDATEIEIAERPSAEKETAN